MKREKSGYTIIYASVMVIIVALGLSLTHQLLLDRQNANMNIDKMQQILRSLNLSVVTDEAESKYYQLVTNAYLIDDDGEKMEGSDDTAPEGVPFSMEPGDPNATGLPLFEATIDDKVIYIVPMNGAGLWGPIWGFLAIEGDGTTIYGADFAHSGETPGLGAEITERAFAKSFVGKEIIKEGGLLSVAVVKPGGSDRRRDYVDGISGGTLTSRGVEKMMFNSLGRYKNFFLKLNSEKKEKQS